MWPNRLSCCCSCCVLLGRCSACKQLCVTRCPCTPLAPHAQSLLEVLDEMRRDLYLAHHVRHYSRELRAVAYTQVGGGTGRKRRKGEAAVRHGA